MHVRVRVCVCVCVCWNFGVQAWVLKKFKAGSLSRRRLPRGSLPTPRPASWIQLNSAEPATGPLPAHTAVLWEPGNCAPSGQAASLFCPTREGNPGVGQAATVEHSATPLPPVVPSSLPPAGRSARARIELCASLRPAAYIWPAPGRRPPQTAEDMAPSVGAGWQRIGSRAWAAGCRRRLHRR
jgi:hypothetical protein